MLTEMELQNFKSWASSGPIRLAPITGFFGINSSGKTALLQALLLLKQTAESIDRSRPLHLGDEQSYVDLGTFHDLIFAFEQTRSLTLRFVWNLPNVLKVKDPHTRSAWLIEAKTLGFETTIGSDVERGMHVRQFFYELIGSDTQWRFGMRRQKTDERKYDLIAEGYTPKRTRGRPWPLPPPVKCYGFPDEVNTYFQNVGFLADIVLTFERQMRRLYYLGPLREYPRRIYVWSGERPDGVGLRGELAIPALLAAQRERMKVRMGRHRRKKEVTQCVAEWLKMLGLIHSFEIQPLAPNRKEYEVRVRRRKDAPAVLLTDVGFGVSQILPVLTLCYYAPEDSILLFEQPEIHLHPSVQAGLADVFIDVVTHRRIQIIIESHSEHLLRRLQRRIAEEQLAAEKTALYFITSQEDGASRLQHLDVDEYGFIRNWPDNFFGDEMGELSAMTKAALARRRRVRD